MYANKTFQKFCRERNVKESTKQGYESALKSYTQYHQESLNTLLDEAISEENQNIPLKNRKIKKRLLSYRSYLLKSKSSPNTVRTYFTKVKTFYRHFEVEIPVIPDAQYNKLYETSYLDLPTKNHIQQALDIVGVDLRAIILFMSSSGTAKAETLSLTVD